MGARSGEARLLIWPLKLVLLVVSTHMKCAPRCALAGPVDFGQQPVLVKLFRQLPDDVHSHCDSAALCAAPPMLPGSKEQLPCNTQVELKPGAKPTSHALLHTIAPSSGQLGPVAGKPFVHLQVFPAYAAVESWTESTAISPPVDPPRR